jgi:hypothetical protein
VALEGLARPVGLVLLVRVARVRLEARRLRLPHWVSQSVLGRLRLH